MNARELFNGILADHAAGQAKVAVPLIPTACEECGEDFDEVGSPHVEALELSGWFVCDDCAAGVIEDNGQFGVGA